MNLDTFQDGVENFMASVIDHFTNLDFEESIKKQVISRRILSKIKEKYEIQSKIKS